MNAIRPSTPKWLGFDEIDFPTTSRAYNATDVSALANSIRAIGPDVAAHCRRARLLLIAGRHRLEALRVIGEERVPVRVVEMDDIEARLATTISEEPGTGLEIGPPLARAEQIDEWRKLTAIRVAQAGPPSAGMPKQQPSEGALGQGGRGESHARPAGKNFEASARTRGSAPARVGSAPIERQGKATRCPDVLIRRKRPRAQSIIGCLLPARQTTQTTITRPISPIIPSATSRRSLSRSAELFT